MPTLPSRFIASLVALAALSGCAAYGPSAMPKDQLAYTLSVARSLEEQLLLNIVRTRYGEAPTFVDVSAIVAGYEYKREGSVGGEAHINNGLDSFVAPGVTIGLTEKPTVTYAPLAGEGYARTMVAPIPPHLVLLMMQSGWSADAVLNLAVRSINGYRNRLPRLVTNAPADPEFARISLLVRQLQDSGSVDFTVREEQDKKRAIFMTLRASDDGTARIKVNELRKLLGTDPETGEIPISVGLLAPVDRGITIYTFSLFQILVAQGKHVVVPDGTAGLGKTEDDAPGIPSIQVRSGRERPKSAAVAVPYGGYWFWIEGDDTGSKVTLMALTVLYRLLESGSPGNLPVLTIPAG
ncbi:MAG TPA: hypothetical protein VHB46_06710 [Burkholderiales bacterium]|nr:hypothetical protein [Burkholderiales bacterium]